MGCDYFHPSSLFPQILYKTVFLYRPQEYYNRISRFHDQDFGKHLLPIIYLGKLVFKRHLAFTMENTQNALTLSCYTYSV